MLIGAVMIVLCLLPFILMANNRRKKKNEFQQMLLSTAKSSGGSISKSEFVGHFMIGVDEISRQLFYVLKKDKEFECKAVDLKNTSKCTFVKTTSENPLDKESPIINSVLLEFSIKGDHKSSVYLEFYNINNNKSLSGELQVAQRWEKTLNEEFLSKNN